ncbi:MAG: cell division protein FtsZ [Candidatus Saccharibacteria bacterium]|nr:cell division protein FtsZ [Candidatus Saccharibacteria bacterium]
MPEVKPNDIDSEAKIKVVGVGGAGGHAIDRMREVGLSGVELIAVNTDAQQLRSTKADVKVPLHMDSTKGLGAGADPAKGEKAADESREDIKKALEGADMVFVTFGAGGGTGSGAGYIVAEEARKLGILTVGVVTKPFSIEGKVRKRNADWAIEHMARSVDALITIPNDRLMEVVDVNIPWRESLRIADDVLRQGVQGVSEIITEEHDINLDFADVCAIIKDAGSALMGIGRASGENRAAIAAQQAIESPLLEVSIDGARGVLYLVSGPENVSMAEVQEAGAVITANVSEDANIIMGWSVRPELEDEIMVTVIATGFDSEYYNSDPRAQSVINPVAEPEVQAAPVAMPVAEPEPVAPVAEPEPVVEPQQPMGSEEFTSTTTTNMWNSGVFGSQADDDNDLPAILRRHKRNKNN